MRKRGKYGLAEFLVMASTGPLSLFQRVRQVMAAPRRLAARPNQLTAIARTWPSTRAELETILDFHATEWVLYSVLVRQDTGKFVESTWWRKIGEKFYGVTIGYGDRVERIWWQYNCPDPPDFSEWIAAENMNQRLVEAVGRVNAELLAQNAPFPQAVRPLLPRDGRDK